jgi:hypothetical protein
MPALDVEALLRTARDETGLDDFGDPTFREGLEVLVESLLRDAKLNEVGRESWHAQLAGHLRERLRIEDWYRRHPEIGEQRIVRPVVVTGLPRTGTTALSNLLAQDPEARSLRAWESSRPTPPPETASEHSDPRIAEADASLAGIQAAAPELAGMHDATGTGPTENQDLLGMHFRTQHFEGMANVSGYLDWWLGCDMAPAYRHHRRVLQLLQWRCPPTRWNLKNPPEIFCLDAMTGVYPDARIVWTHRDPARVLPSVCSLIATIRAIFDDGVEREAMGPAQLESWAEGARRALAFRDRVGEERFADVQMDELVADPVRVVAGIYQRFELPFSAGLEARLRRWAEQNPQGKHGAHRYALEDFGLDAGAVREAFRFYTERFDVRLES